MKTIDDKAWYYAQTIQIDDYGKEKVEDAFCEGVKFAQRWVPIDEELPPLHKPILTKHEEDGKTFYDPIILDYYPDIDTIKTWIKYWRLIELE